MTHYTPWAKYAHIYAFPSFYYFNCIARLIPCINNIAIIKRKPQMFIEIKNTECENPPPNLPQMAIIKHGIDVF